MSARPSDLVRPEIISSSHLHKRRMVSEVLTGTKKQQIQMGAAKVLLNVCDRLNLSISAINWASGYFSPPYFLFYPSTTTRHEVRSQKVLVSHHQLHHRAT